MRLGFYWGRSTGRGGGMFLYAGELLAQLLQSPDALDLELFVYCQSAEMPALVENYPEVFSRQSARINFRELTCALRRKVALICDHFLLPKLLRQDQVQVLHSLANYGLLFPPCLQIVTVHDLYQAWPASGFAETQSIKVLAQQTWYRTLAKRQSRNAHALIADSSLVSDELISDLGVSPRRVFTIPLGVDIALLQHIRRFQDAGLSGSMELKAALAALTKLAPGYVLHLASLDPRKNTVRAIKAWREFALQARNSQTSIVTPLLVIAADCQCAAQVRKLLHEEITSGSAEVRTWVSRSEYALLLYSAGCLLFPSLGEGFGLPPLEALAAGIAVVSPQLPHLSAYAKSRPLFFCESSDLSSVVRCLNEALNQVGNLRNSPERVVPPVRTMREVAQQTLEVYRQVLKPYVQEEY